MRFFHIIREWRKAEGLTQTELGALASVSLPFVQNIETGKANPSLRIVQALLETLGVEIDCKPAPYHWDLFSAYGAPLTSVKNQKNIKPTPEGLVTMIRKACFYLTYAKEEPEKERKKEALEALLLALQTHYPHFFNKNFKRSSLVYHFVPKIFTPRLIKLRRIALSKLGEYL